MSVVELNAQDATGSQDCTTPLCDGVAKSTTGPWAGKCPHCISVEMSRRHAVRRGDADSTRKPKAKTGPRPAEDGSLEARVRDLLPVARGVDRAAADVRRTRSATEGAEEVLRAAIAEWRTALSSIAGAASAATMSPSSER